MSYRIANEMSERIGNMLNDVVVEFCLGALEQEFNRFAGRFGSIADRAGKPGIQSADGHHARGGNFILE